MKKMLMMKKMKRKDLELDEFSDDFSDFSLSAPARKIRRLDAELPPIMEEEEAIIEDLELSPNNEEMAIVLFKPVNAPFVQHSPSNLSFSVDSELISGFKKEEASNAATRGCLAVVPWVPSQLPPMPATQMEAPEASELMEAEETGATTMDIEEDYNNAGIGQVHPSVNVCGEMPGSEGLHQWQQQHCMMPQFPQNTSTPITWFR
ncbi:hypothetical protein CFP56_009873 [Quercus suber]|uniref:Uncharacterized protein n=1 Tax=Quercus suber TaxID=58331 RepID=A0AAW0L351_QUESU